MKMRRSYSFRKEMAEIKEAHRELFQKKIAILDKFRSKLAIICYQEDYCQPMMVKGIIGHGWLDKPSPHIEFDKIIAIKDPKTHLCIKAVNIRHIISIKILRKKNGRKRI
ncbi:hypothetical protein JW977_02810 [Candidatus Falkowbacteria bacterium]|nr:hypothetical protein [Candidatus Falkowbacteria bacterium]